MPPSRAPLVLWWLLWGGRGPGLARCRCRGEGASRGGKRPPWWPMCSTWRGGCHRALHTVVSRRVGQILPQVGKVRLYSRGRAVARATQLSIKGLGDKVAGRSAEGLLEAIGAHKVGGKLPPQEIDQGNKARKGAQGGVAPSYHVPAAYAGQVLLGLDGG